MKVPFVQHVGIGLAFTPRSVRWVELSRLRHRVTIQHLDREEIRKDESGPNDALHRLTERIQPRDPHVASHLPVSQVREIPIEVPPFREDIARRDWIEQHAAELLPQGVDVANFVVRYVPFAADRGGANRKEPTRAPKRPHEPIADESTSDTERGLLMVARRDAVAAHKDMLRDAGLEPAFVGSVTPLLGFGLGFDPVFGQQAQSSGGRAVALWIRAQGGVLASFREGRLADVSFLPGSPVAGKAVAQVAAELQVESKTSHPLFVIGVEATAWVRERQTTFNGGWMLRAFNLSAHPKRGEGTRGEARGMQAATRGQDEGPGPAPDAPAFALAAGLIYAADDNGNFLTRDEVDAARRAAERRDGRRTVAVAAAVCIVLLLIATGSVYGLQHYVHQAERAVQSQAGHLARVDSAKRRLEALRQRVDRVEAVTSLRTALAPLLELVSRQAPDGMWLEDLRVTTGGSEAFSTPVGQREWMQQASQSELTAEEVNVESLKDNRTATFWLHGWALHPKAPGALVAALEKHSRFAGVRPVVVERVDGASAKKRAVRWPERATPWGTATFFTIRFEASLFGGETHNLRGAIPRGSTGIDSVPQARVTSNSDP